MPIMIVSKGKDFTAWRAAGDFAVTCRQNLLKRTESLLSDESEVFFDEAVRELERRTLEHDASLARLRGLTAQAAAVATPDRFKALLGEFYAENYAFFGQNRSSSAFFQLSDEFVSAVCAALVAHAREKLGQPASDLPPLAIIALGVCTCHEMTPFWRLQLVLVHGEAQPPQERLVAAFYHILHDSFETAGLRLDMQITPLNPEWRGSMADWQQRLSLGLEQGGAMSGGDIIKLANQQALYSEQGLADVFRNHCMLLLSQSRAALAFMVARVTELSNGIGLMGGLRLEKKGPQRGLFGLLDHALLPLSASVSVLNLIKGGGAAGTPRRIRELLNRGAIDVDMAERLLEAWHLFSELRLKREAALQPEWGGQAAFYLDLNTLDGAEQDRFKACLETVAMIQRHVGIAFGSWEERP